MFTATIPPVAYRDPWQQSLEDRLAALLRPASHRVAWLYELPDTSTFRYRCHNMVQALEGERDIAAAWFARADIPALVPLLDRCDTLVVCRVRYDDSVAHVLERARQLGVDTVFDCDDLVFDPDYVHLVLHTLDQAMGEQAWDCWFASIGRIGATMRQCNRAIVTNAFLADRLRAAAPGKDVRVVPNFLDREQLDVSLRLYAAKRHSGFARDGRVHIGYFSGTPTHNHDFAIVEDALADLLRTDARVVLRLVGFLRPSGALAAFEHRIERAPLHDFLNLQRLIGGVEFNIVPLRANDFTNCKSELKYFEAAIVGTATLAAPTHAFRTAIADGDNGWLVPSYGWDEALRTALASLDDYAAMAQRAFRHTLACYRPEAMVPAIRAALFAPADQAQSRSSAPSAPSTGSAAGSGTAALARRAAAYSAGSPRFVSNAPPPG